MNTSRGRAATHPLGFTLIELIVVISVIGIMLALFLPAIRTSGEAARRMGCQNNMRQIGIALHNYHDTHKCFPAGLGGTTANQQRLGATVWLLPYLEQSALWVQVSNPLTVKGQLYPEMGPPPWDAKYPPWTTQLQVLRCPSLPGDAKAADEFGLSSYGYCVGDLARDIHQPATPRGVFGGNLNVTFRDITDGSSQTIMLAEMGTSPIAHLASRLAIDQPRTILESPARCLDLRHPKKERQYARGVLLSEHGRGANWADGAAGFSLVNTILPPNSPSCSIGDAADDGLYSAGSFHPGGVQVVFVDASCHFIANNVDVGDLQQPTPTAEQMRQGVNSPYGVWGALGTAAAQDEAQVD